MLTTEKEILEYCNKNFDYTQTLEVEKSSYFGGLVVNTKGSITIQKDVKIKELEVQFGEVRYNFILDNCGLESFKGFPYSCINCSVINNNLSSFEFAPFKTSTFKIANNKFTSFGSKPKGSKWGKITLIGNSFIYNPIEKENIKEMFDYKKVSSLLLKKIFIQQKYPQDILKKHSKDLIQMVKDGIIKLEQINILKLWS